jgi:hypothetical protein
MKKKVNLFYLILSITLLSFISCSGEVGQEQLENVDFAEVIKLVENDGLSKNYFGISVSISGDNAIVGACNSETNSGSAYIFIRDGATWTQTSKLLPSDGEIGDQFGNSVSISGDTAIVGAHSNDYKGDRSGSAYIFIRDGAGWTQTSKLVADDGAEWDEFGMSVSISGDTAIVGACFDDDNDIRSGSAYIFTRDGAGWTQTSKLLPSDRESGDKFGWAVSISGDTAIIGAYYDDDKGTRSGSAYIFSRDGAAWTQTSKLVADDGSEEDFFGCSVAISGDTAIVGARLDDDKGNNSGSAYIFTEGATTWTQTSKLVVDDGAEDDNFGRSVSISGDTAIIGSNSDGKGLFSGSAYIFTRGGNNWTQTCKLLADDGSEEDFFGCSVAISGDTAIIGASYDDDYGILSGSAYYTDRNCLTK